MNTKIKEKEVKAGHDYVCGGCGEVAVYNLQDAWHLFDIDDKGDFSERKTWEGSENEFWCEECFENQK